MSTESISPKVAKSRLDAQPSALLVDVRTPAEHRAVHATGAKNVPLDTLDQGGCKALCSERGDGDLYLLCKSGQRARMAAERFVAAGIERVFVVDGGTEAWEREGLPVERGQGVMDLERQVRIAAGSLVAVGVLGSLLVHPALVYLSLFVGCGLVFAGITNTCAMGMMIAKMPWNRK